MKGISLSRSDPATVDDPGRCRGGGAGGIRRVPTARRLRLEQERRRTAVGSPTRSSRSTPSKSSTRSSATPGSTATINYQDVHAAPQRVDNVPLPWSYTITTTDPAVIANVVAQGNGNTLGCRITVNGVVKDERTVNEVSAYTFCLDKSG